MSAATAAAASTTACSGSNKRRRIRWLGAVAVGGVAATMVILLGGWAGGGWWTGSPAVAGGGGAAAAAAARILSLDSLLRTIPVAQVVKPSSSSASQQQHQHQQRRLAATKGGGAGGGASSTGIMSLSSSSSLHHNIDPAVNPILLLGLPKSGSEAIHHFLTCLRSDWTSQHYCCDGSNRTRFACHRDNHREQTCGRCVHRNMLKGRRAFERCHGQNKNASHIYAQFDAEATGDGDEHEWFLPQHFALPLLHRDYPRAVWILNTRNPIKWAINVRHWYSTAVRLLNAFDLSYHDPTSSSMAQLDNNEDDGANSEVGTVLQKQSHSNNQNKNKNNNVTTREQQMYAELQWNLDRARNATPHERRLQDLISVYEQHTVKVRDFARNYHRARRQTAGLFLEVNVDAGGTGTGDDKGAEPPYLTLARGLGLLQKMGANGGNGGDDKEAVARAKACWQYDADALDNDWKNFAIDV